MDQKTLDFLKERFGYKTWDGSSDIVKGAVIQNLTLSEVLFPDLAPGRIREIDPRDGTRLLRASWSTADEKNHGVSADIRECESVEKARYIVLELLGNLQGPGVKRMDTPIGDVSFGAASSQFAIFARGNIAVYIRTIGDIETTVEEYARTLDKELERAAH